MVVDPALVADLVGEGRLEHAAVDRLAIGPGLAGRDVDQVGAGLGEGAADLDRLVGRDAELAHPVVGRDAHRHRLVRRPGRAHRPEHFEREAQPVLEAAAIFVGALVGERGDEAGQQIAVGGVELDHVEAGLEPHAAPRRRTGRRTASMSARVIGRGTWLSGAPRHVGGGHDRPVAARRAARHSLPSRPWCEPFGPRMAELEAEFRLAVGVDEIDDPPPRRDMLGRVDAGAARRDPALRRDAGHLGVEQAGAALRAGAVMDEVEVVRACRPRPNTSPSARRRRGWRAPCSRSRNGANIGGAGSLTGAPERLRLEPALDALQPGLVAQPQIFVADALRAGEQRISELDRLEMEIAVERLEPFGRVARAVLELQHLEVALGLIFGERRVARRGPGRFSTSASLIASSSASLVPEPIEKWAVWAASPSRIRLP